MRAVTLSNRNVRNYLENNFVVGWTNIKNQTPYAGTSGHHYPWYPAVQTTTCAGHHNVQMFFLTSDGRVLHCLPGYWRPADFLLEAKFARGLDRNYRNPNISVMERNEGYINLHLTHAREHSAQLQKSSRHQGFDKSNLERRAQTDARRERGWLTNELKRTDQLMHERMAERPFLPIDSFEIGEFVDMGRKAFDSHNDGCRDQDAVHDMQMKAEWAKIRSQWAPEESKVQSTH